MDKPPNSINFNYFKMRKEEWGNCKYRFAGKKWDEKEMKFTSIHNTNWKFHYLWDLFHPNKDYIYRATPKRYYVYKINRWFSCSSRKYIILDETEFFKYFIPNDPVLLRKMKLKELDRKSKM